MKKLLFLLLLLCCYSNPSFAVQDCWFGWGVSVEGRYYGEEGEPFDLRLDGVEYREPYHLTTKEAAELSNALRKAKTIELVYGPNQQVKLKNDFKNVVLTLLSRNPTCVNK